MGERLRPLFQSLGCHLLVPLVITVGAVPEIAIAETIFDWVRGEFFGGFKTNLDPDNHVLKWEVVLDIPGSPSRSIPITDGQSEIDFTLSDVGNNATITVNLSAINAFSCRTTESITLEVPEQPGAISFAVLNREGQPVEPTFRNDDGRFYLVIGSPESGDFVPV